MRRLFLALGFVVAIAAGGGSPSAAAAGEVKVVATFSILADLARNVGGDRIAVSTLVGPNADVHVYTPAPADVKKIAAAKLVIVNGLGLEGWLDRLTGASGGKTTLVVASKGIAPLKSGSGQHLDTDPHAWQSVANAKIYVGNIRDALIGVDPQGADVYRLNAARYLAALDRLDRKVRDAVASIPPDRRRVISTHNAFAYFAAAYGIAFIAPQGVSTATEPSARDVAAIIMQIRKEKIPAIFIENISDPRLIERIAAETGARVGGTLYSDSLTGENGPAPTYIDMVNHNIKALTSALRD